MTRNIIHCKAGLFYDDDTGYPTAIDNEIQRSEKIIRLIEAIE
jgi:hypothetical protein